MSYRELRITHQELSEQADQSEQDYHPDIVEQLLNNIEWESVPEIIHLTVKAINKSLSSHSQKFIEQRVLLNDVSLKTKQLDIGLMQKLSRKDFNREIENCVKMLIVEQKSNKSQKSESEDWREQGLGKIMIEQVKTIASSLIEQRLEQQRNLNKTEDKYKQKIEILQKELNNQRQLITKIKHKLQLQISNIWQNSNKQSNQVLELIRKNAIEKMYKSHSIEVENKKNIYNDHHQWKNNLEKLKADIYQQIKTIKETSEKKKKIQQNRELSEFKHKIEKELVGTLHLPEIQTIVNSLRQQIFQKQANIQKELSGLSLKINNLKKYQNQPHKQYEQEEQTRIKKHEIIKNHKDDQKEGRKGKHQSSDSPSHHHIQSVKQIKMSLARVEKVLSSNNTTRATEDIIERALINQRKHNQVELTKRQKKICQFVQSHYKELNTDKLNKNQIKKALLTLGEQLLQCRYLYYGERECKGLLVWQKQAVNTMQQNFSWNRGQSSIVVHASGLYKIEGGLYGQKNVECYLLVNNQAVGMLKSNEFLGQGKCRGYTFCEAILLPSKVKVSMRVDKNFYGQAYLQIHKL